MNIAICDDCRSDAETLRYEIEKYTDSSGKNWYINCFQEGTAFAEKAGGFDVVLLDIEMPKLNGIETGRLAKETNPELKIIMFTGAEGYGEAIFDIGALNYLSKPVNPTRLIRALNDVEALLIGNEMINAHSNWLPYKFRQRDIDYIKAYNGYVLLYCGNKEFRIDKSLTEIEKELDSRIFLKIDKSIIINLMAVKELKENYFIVNGKQFKISRRRLNNAKKTWVEFDLKYNTGRGQK